MKENKENKKTKILAISDIHGDSQLAKKLAKRAEKEKVDLIIIAGDITLVDREVKGIIKPFTDLNKEVLLIPGNHDTLSTIRSMVDFYPTAKNLHGYSVMKGDLGIFGAGYDSNVGPFWVEDEDIFKTLKKSHDGIKDAKKKLMITHAHPSGGKLEKLGFVGSKAVEKAIKKFKPNLAISGHIHEGGGIVEYLHGVKSVNVARNAAIFEI